MAKEFDLHRHERTDKLPTKLRIPLTTLRWYEKCVSRFCEESVRGTGLGIWDTEDKYTGFVVEGIPGEKLFKSNGFTISSPGETHSYK